MHAKVELYVLYMSYISPICIVYYTYVDIGMITE
jgi:hypothetical protein